MAENLEVLTSRALQIRCRRQGLEGPLRPALLGYWCLSSYTAVVLLSADALGSWKYYASHQRALLGIQPDLCSEDLLPVR